MIGRLRGVIAERHPDGSCIVDVGGVGYECFVPMGSLGRLPRPPEVVTLHVHTHAREDALLLYAFASGDDRQAFRTLLGVSTIGPKLALSILSHLGAGELAAAIAREDRAAFKGISGVGKRTVERLLLELKDKLLFAAALDRPATPAPTPVATNTSGPLGKVADALVAMGFRPSEAERALAAVAERADETDSDALLRLALAELS